MDRYRYIWAVLTVFVISSAINFAGAQTPGKAVERVRIGTPSPASIAILQLKIAELKGFFREEGIQAEIIQMRVPISLVA